MAPPTSCGTTGNLSGTLFTIIEGPNPGHPHLLLFEADCCQGNERALLPAPLSRINAIELENAGVLP